MDFRRVLDRVERPFTFAVVGDSHFSHPRFYPEPDREAPSRRPLKVEKYIENVHYVLTPMMEFLKAEAPAFVVLTGDLVEGHRNAALARAEMQAGLDFFSSYGIPLLIARGNQDHVQGYDETVRPFLSEGLGWDLEDRFYFTDVAGCRLIFLDTADWQKGGAQRRWLEALLEQTEGLRISRTFLFGHHPIWPLARAFFSVLDFHRDLPEVLARHPVDAYFCGHTHNQNLIQHRTEGLPALQFAGAPIGLPEEIPTPLDRVHTLLPSPGDLLACWPGYLENTAPGWFMVRVGAHSVQVEWHHLNRGVETSVRWHRRGEIAAFRRMVHPPDARLIYSDLNHIRRASLRFCAWGISRASIKVLLNGVEVGALPPGDEYVPRRMELPSRALPCLRMENRLEVRAPEDGAVTVGNLLIEGVLPGGRLVRTSPSEEIFTWSNRWKAWGVSRVKMLRHGRPAIALLSFR